MSSILVITEIHGGKYRSVNNEVCTAARQLGEALNKPVAAVMVGSRVQPFVEKAGAYGIEQVLAVEDAALEKYSPDAYAAVIAEVARQKGAEVILMGASFTGKDLMARVAQILEVPLAQDCIAFRVDNGQIFFTRPMYAGKVRAEVRVNASPVMATLRPKAFTPAEKATSPTVEAVSVTVPQPLAVVEAIEESAGEKLDVTEADIIVSGGRGMKGPENWHILEELAEVLGAALGCSRPVSDEGWRSHDEHIGQTGKTVAPDLYIACGISGAIQHIAGMSSSKYILAINKDPEAPIFKVADYGLVGDLFQIVPRLTEEIKKLKARD